MEQIQTFPVIEKESVALQQCAGRVLAQEVICPFDLPGFNRATMDGFAVQARSTFGATESMPALIQVIGSVRMGEKPTIHLGPGEAVHIATGGMLPQGADAVVMVEHTQHLDNETVEIYKSVSPLQHVLELGEDFRKGEAILTKGQQIRPQEMGILAALGQAQVTVYKQPTVAIVSTGDEIVPVETIPDLSQLRDVNAYTLSGLVSQAGGVPLYLGIAQDSFEDLNRFCRQGLEQAHVVLISGGSSVGTRDFTLDVLQQLPHGQILVHGVSISPGKPTILARTGDKAVWGLPGQVTSAMVVFHTMVRPAIDRIRGLRRAKATPLVTAKLTRNIVSVQGREDFIRVKLIARDKGLFVEPILGKSGLIRTMVEADGMIRLDKDSEGLDLGSPVDVFLFDTTAG